jgi:hypothetical protein
MVSYEIPDKASEIAVDGFKELEAVPDKTRDSFAARVLHAFTPKELAESLVAASACDLINFRDTMLIAMLTDKGAFNRHLKVNHNVFIAFQLGFLHRNYPIQYEEARKRAIV